MPNTREPRQQDGDTLRARGVRRRGAAALVAVVAGCALALWAVAVPFPAWFDGLPRVVPSSAAELLPVARTFTHAGYVSVLAFSPDGRYLAAGSVLDRNISVWDVKSGALSKQLVLEVGATDALAWSPDGRWLAVGQSFTKFAPRRVDVTVWDVPTGRVVHELTEPFHRKDRLATARWLGFTPDGKRLAVAYGGLAVYEAATGQLITTMSGHPALGAAMAYSRDGRYLATSGEPRRAPIEIYDGATNAHVGTLRADLGVQAVLVFSPDGRFIASAGLLSPDITIWDVDAGQPARPKLQGHAGQVRALAYSPDGAWLASLSPADAVRVWATRDEWPSARIPVGRGVGRALAFSPDGHFLAYGQAETVKLWDFRAGVPALLNETKRRKG